MADEESSAASFEKLAEEASSLQAEEEEAQDEKDAEAELEAYLMAKSELEEATTFKNDEVCISLLFYHSLFLHSRSDLNLIQRIYCCYLLKFEITE